jgi:hypothetical protein
MEAANDPACSADDDPSATAGWIVVIVAPPRERGAWGAVMGAVANVKGALERVAQSSQARNQNYEQILRMVNDVLQGNFGGIGFVFGGTPEFLMDTRRGLYSYAALQSRLAENSFARNGLVDLSGPVLRLQSLTPEDLMILLSNIRTVFASGDSQQHLVPDEALPAFMEHCNRHVGEAYFRTPRNTIKAFV